MLPAEKIHEEALRNKLRVLDALVGGTGEDAELLVLENDPEVLAEKLLSARQLQAAPASGTAAAFVDDFVARPVPRKRTSVADLYGHAMAGGESPVRRAADRAKRGDDVTPSQSRRLQRKSVTEKEVQDALQKLFKEGRSSGPTHTARKEKDQDNQDGT